MSGCTSARRRRSAIQGSLLVLIVGFAVARVATARAATLSAVVRATSVGIQIFARVAHPEIAVVLAITVTELLVVAYLVSHDRSQRLVLATLAGAAIGYGVLAKGPVAIVLPTRALAATVVLTWFGGKVRLKPDPTFAAREPTIPMAQAWGPPEQVWGPPLGGPSRLLTPIVCDVVVLL